MNPDFVISLGARIKAAGETMAGEEVELVAHEDPGGQMSPYERLLGDAMRGDATLFNREDAVEAAWRVVDPVVGDKTPLYEYEPNTWGPHQADAVAIGLESWHNPV